MRRTRRYVVVSRQFSDYHALGCLSGDANRGIQLRISSIQGALVTGNHSGLVPSGSVVVRFRGQ